MYYNADFWRSTHINNRQIIKVERQIRLLQIDYEAKYETYKELKQEKKIKKLKEQFNEKNMILTKKKEKLQAEVEDFVKRKMIEEKLHLPVRSKLQLFMDTMKKLEGVNNNPVNHVKLVRTLVDTDQFTQESANETIRKMIREASIYEVDRDHYRRV